MTRAEIARLDRRIDGVDETVRALSDSILEIQEVQGEHSATLDHSTAATYWITHTAVLDQHTATLDQHTAVLTSLDERVSRLEVQMLQISAQLAEVLRRLPEPG